MKEVDGHPQGGVPVDSSPANWLPIVRVSPRPHHASIMISDIPSRMLRVAACRTTRTGSRASISSKSPLADVWVVIPARNKEESLPLVLQDLPQVGRVIVVDNGSTDATAVRAAARGAVVVSEVKPGYGRACLAGMDEIRRAIATGEDPPRVLVFLNGDYSDYPEYLRELVEPILKGEADFVLGSRILGAREVGTMPPQRFSGNKLACALMRWIWKANYTDLGPFRAIDYPALRALQMSDPNFGWTVEMQVKAVLAGLRTLEIPVPYRRRGGVSRTSSDLWSAVRAGTKILWTIAKYAWTTRGVGHSAAGLGK